MPKGNNAVATQAAPVAEKKFTPPSIEAMKQKGLATKSAQIRHLFATGEMTKGEIAKHMGVIYQHVYNVLSKPLKTSEAAPTTPVPATQEVAPAAA